MKISLYLLLCGLLSWNGLNAQRAEIRGLIVNENNEPLADANIAAGEDTGTRTGKDGTFSLQILAGTEVLLRITHLGYKQVLLRVWLAPGELREIDMVLSATYEQVGEINLFGNSINMISGFKSIDPETFQKIPGANPGIENLLKTLPGVNSNNELSTQYSVRGGNYDENLVYINGYQIYKPFLLHSGQQEGLSFINPDLVREVHFSAGGFQAKYGDKMSSILDIRYRRPTDFSASMEMSLLGLSTAIEGTSKDRKFTALGGFRYRDNSLLLGTQQAEANFRPTYMDAQLNLSYELSESWEFGFFGHYSLNNFQFRPITSQTNFGTLQDPRALVVYYNGQEKDRYKAFFGAVKASWTPTVNHSSRFSVAAHQTGEQEYYDILGRYVLTAIDSGDNDRNGTDIRFSEGIGGQLTHGRNRLQASILNLEYSGTSRREDHQFDYGAKYTYEDIHDRINSYEIIDSAGFSLRPPLPDFVKDEPYDIFVAPLEPFNATTASNDTRIHRFQVFGQWSRRFNPGNQELWLNIGLRSHSWRINDLQVRSPLHVVVSPRAQVAWKPDWKKDMLFRLSGGYYHQPPFYGELRGPTGKVDPDVAAQQAIHLVVANDYSFSMLSRPFKLTTEAYYKDLNQVNPYTLENVRIDYAAHNNAEAYAYGLDLRLNGDFVPGMESWLSIGYLKTEENISNRGYIPRPTDQRLKFAVLFQDYVPKVPDLKMYLNLVYNTGLPGGAPAYADVYFYRSRLRDYHRADLGLSYMIDNQEKKTLWKGFKEFSIGMEILNIFDRRNTITNTFVRDVHSKVQYAVPNYLTSRVYNLKLNIKI